MFFKFTFEANFDRLFLRILFCPICLCVVYDLQKTQKQNATACLRTCNNILAMTQVSASPRIGLLHHSRGELKKPGPLV